MGPGRFPATRSRFALVKPRPVLHNPRHPLPIFTMNPRAYLCATLVFLSGSSTTLAAEWISLFNGKTLTGWTTLDGEPITKGWVVEDGTIHRASRGGDIITTQEFRDFILEFEWKISQGGNSGVKYRIQRNVGLEYQILDDDKHPDRKKPNHRTASFYDLLAAPDDKPVKPVGQWNQAKIVARGPVLEHWLNGELVLTLDQSTDDWHQRFQNSKYRKRENFGQVRSPILLQDHQDPVWFRNLRIQKLDPQPQP